jgi:hypothetical protein
MIEICACCVEKIVVMKVLLKKLMGCDEHDYIVFVVMGW